MSSQRWRLVPLVFITYSLAYLDRSNYSIGVAGGLKHFLALIPARSALLGTVFFLGYLAFQLPAAHYAENRSVRTLIFWCVLLWGVFARAQGVIPCWWLLLIDRFALGVVEAAIIPAMLIFLLHWFSRAGRGRANTFLISTRDVGPLSDDLVGHGTFDDGRSPPTYLCRLLRCWTDLGHGGGRRWLAWRQHWPR